jgi:hypothetical protein
MRLCDTWCLFVVVFRLSIKNVSKSMGPPGHFMLSYADVEWKAVFINGMIKTIGIEIEPKKF